MKRFKKNNKGFSLVELIVVIAIMAILGVAVALAVTKFIPQSQRSTDISNAKMIAEACEVAVNDFATAPSKTINSVTEASVFPTAGEDGFCTVSLDNLVSTGLLKSNPTIQGISGGGNFDVKYKKSTGEVKVYVTTGVDLMNETQALNYKNNGVAAE